MKLLLAVVFFFSVCLSSINVYAGGGLTSRVEICNQEFAECLSATGDTSMCGEMLEDCLDSIPTYVLPKDPIPMPKYEAKPGDISVPAF